MESLAITDTSGNEGPRVLLILDLEQGTADHGCGSYLPPVLLVAFHDLQQ